MHVYGHRNHVYHDGCTVQKEFDERGGGNKLLIIMGQKREEEKR
jgi:hypothetical protein